MKSFDVTIALIICIAWILPISAFVSDTENNGIITLDLTPDITIASEGAPEFQPMNVKIVKIEEKTEITVWESDINEQKDINIPVPVGKYKLYVQLHGHRTIWELDNEGMEYEVSLSSSTMVPAWKNSPGKEVFADGPWRVQSNEIPILVMIKDADEIYGDYDLGNVEIYLDEDCDEDINEVDDIFLEIETKWDGIIVDESFYNLYNPGDWYGITYLDPSKYGLSGEVCFHIVIRDIGGPLDPDGDSHSFFKVKVNPDNLPVFPGWHPGDIHYHSSYTDSLVEFGFPIEATVEAGKAIGLDWNAITDHSFDVKDSKTADPNHKWNALKNDVNTYTTNSYKLILGEEVSCFGHKKTHEWGDRGIIHFLVLGMENFRDVNGAGIDFIPGDRDEDIFDGQALNIEDVINIVNTQGGVSYAAHPEGHRETYNTILGRVPWITEDYDLIGYNGLQVWNEKKTQDDGWETQRKAGLEQWRRQLTEQGRKDVFIAGGSDAHGDFSHATSIKENSDNAFGKVRTYVYTRTFDNDGILNALENGHSIMTDGPLLIFNITNEHGETAIIGDEIAGRDLTLNIQWESTSEFGKLDHIYIHRGIIGETEEEITEYHLTPNNLSGTQMYSNLSKKIPISKTAYIRLNASTDKNSKVYTNPIWINEEKTNFTPLDLCMVLDRSGSMKELMGDIKKIEGVKKAANDVIDVLLSNDRISLISFSDTATTDIDFTSNFNEANTKIDQLNADGGTSFGAGLKKALDQFDVYGNPDHIPAILFMSDGIHNTLPDPDAFVAECKKQGIPIFTVGFASSELEVDVARLKRMSDETGGEYLFADKIFDLQNIFLKLQHKASGWESLATFTGEVNQGEKITAGTFYLDSKTENSRVTLNWPGSDLDLVLYDPNGIQINLDSPNIIYSGDTKPEYVIIKEPQSGTWTVEVYGKITDTSESYYVLVTKYATSISGGLSAQWKFDENTGTTVLDSSGNGNIGIVHGPTWTTGPIGSALQFDGVDDYVDVGSTLNLGENFTISMWAKRDVGSTWRTLISKGESILEKDHNYVLYFSPTNELEFAIGDGANYRNFKTTNIYDTNWHHLVVEFVSSNDMRIYVDGVRQSGTYVQGGTATTPSANFNKTLIGASSTTTEFFNGVIDEVKIYNRVLTEEEIIEDFSGYTTPQV